MSEGGKRRAEWIRRAREGVPVESRSPGAMMDEDAWPPDPSDPTADPVTGAIRDLEGPLMAMLAEREGRLMAAIDDRLAMLVEEQRSAADEHLSLLRKTIEDLARAGRRMERARDALLATPTAAPAGAQPDPWEVYMVSTVERATGATLDLQRGQADLIARLDGASRQAPLWAGPIALATLGLWAMIPSEAHGWPALATAALLGILVRLAPRFRGRVRLPAYPRWRGRQG